MALLQSQGVHHITLNGADRQTSIDFWQGVLGMKYLFDQPNLDVPSENHLYFDTCLLYTSPSPRDLSTSRMPSSA